jgi:hypothetical protein
MDRALRETSHRGLQQETPPSDVEGEDLVAQIHDTRLWTEAQDDPFHDPDKWILHPKIGEQGHDRTRSHPLIPQPRAPTIRSAGETATFRIRGAMVFG